MHDIVGKLKFLLSKPSMALSIQVDTPTVITCVVVSALSPDTINSIGLLYLITYVIIFSSYVLRQF